MAQQFTDARQEGAPDPRLISQVARCVLEMANFGSVIAVQCRATLNLLWYSKVVQEHQFFDRKDNFSGVIRGGMSSSAGLGNAACALREQRAIAPRAQILHPEALPALGQQQVPKDFGEKSCLLGLGSSCCRDANCSAL